MKTSRTILKPVQREDFTTSFSTTASTELAKLPEEFFKHSINDIKKFAVGPYCWFIANTTNGITHFAGGMVEQLTGIPVEQFIQHTPERLFGQIHSDDVSKMFAFTNHWIGYFMSLPYDRKIHVHPTIYIRLKNKEQVFKWVSVQYADHIIDMEGNILFGLTLITDISHVKKVGPAMMSVLDSFDESCQHFYCSDDNSIQNSREALPQLTNREIEILQYLATGKSSKQIASSLEIAIKTIDNHRQNMLRKTQAKSTGELISYAIKGGFI